MRQRSDLSAGTVVARSPGLSRSALVLRLVLRELRGGLKGFGIFLACLALGVAAIAAVGSTSRALNEGIASAGTLVLGGDMSFSLMQREASDREQEELSRNGQLSSIAILRAMAVAGDETALVEIKAVDGLYPVVGTLETTPVLAVDEIFRARNGVFGASADEALFARLGLKAGDRIRLGAITLELRARLDSEPDKIGAGLGFGPRLLMSQEALRATGLIQPGSLVRWTYRLSLAPGKQLLDTKNLIERELPQAGWEIRTRERADPRFLRDTDRFFQYLTLVGLTALLIGGVGVANAVGGYVERKRPSLAVFKSLGATGGLAVTVYFTTVLAIAAMGIAFGCVFGFALPALAVKMFGALIPVPLAPTIAWRELMLATVYGFLITAIFAIAPLGRMHDTPVSMLFREGVTPSRQPLRKRYLVVLMVCVIILAAVSILTAHDRKVALIFIAAVFAATVILRIVAFVIMALARKMPRNRNAMLRLAMTNLYRPGALTPALVLSFGLGVTLLATLNIVDANLRRELAQVLPERAPNFFFLDIPAAQAAAFDNTLHEMAPGIIVERVPNMRGRIVTLKSRPTASVTPPPDVSWVLEGDRGITYSEQIPKGSRLATGAWWPEGYKGKPLVSFEDRIAAALNLSVGDDIVVNVLGRNITATVANTRAVDWRSLGINYVMVFSPNTFAGAPYTQLATAVLPREASTPVLEAAILRRMAKDFPSITSVRVKDQLDALAGLINQLLFAMRGAGAVALAASLLVLAGALASSQRARLYDAVILKTLGATRMRLTGVYLMEYGFLGLVTAVFGIGIGILLSWFIVRQVMNITFAWLIGGAAATAFIAVIVVVCLGLIGTWRILNHKPAAVLKEL